MTHRWTFSCLYLVNIQRKHRTRAPLCPVSGGNPAALLLPCLRGRGESRRQGAWFVSFVASGDSEGGSCVLGVIAHVIHTSPPPLYTSPGPVRRSMYPVKDLWSCPVIPVFTFLLHQLHVPLLSTLIQSAEQCKTSICLLLSKLPVHRLSTYSVLQWLDPLPHGYTLISCIVITTVELFLPEVTQHHLHPDLHFCQSSWLSHFASMQITSM